MEHSLSQSRQERADLTRGISSNVIYQKVLRLIEANQLGGELLEFGAGSGNLLHQLSVQKRFSRMVGVDLLSRPSSLPPDLEWIQADLHHPLSFPDQQFDVILSTEVIEHLENPRAIAREWFRLLKPKGTLVLTTPNQESLRAYCGLIFGGHYVAFLGKSYPAHITALLRLDLQRMLIEAGFRAPRFSYTDSGGVPKFPSVHWQTISLGLLKGRLWSDNLLVIAGKD